MILSLDLRRRNVFAEVMVLTGKLIHELLGKIRRHIGWLTSVAEAVALLDMLVHATRLFAHRSTLTDGSPHPDRWRSRTLSLCKIG